MALIICPECGNQVSDKAEICPHCGIKIAGNVIPAQSEQPQPTFRVQQVQPMQQPMHAQPVQPAQPAQPMADGSKMKPQEKKSHTTLIISFVVALILCGVGYYFYTGTQQREEEKDYQTAMLSDDPEVAQMYLARYNEAPQEHRDSVMAHMNALKNADLAWTNAVAAGTKSALLEYINLMPNSPHKGEALNKIDSLDFAIASRKNNAEAYKEYLNQHPDGRYASQAQDFLEQKEATEVSPEDLAKAKTVCKHFFQAINSRDKNKLLETVSDYLMSFLNRNAASSDMVVTFMEKLYKDDITNMNWHILDDFKAEKVDYGEGGKNLKVQFGAEQKIERTDPSKETYAKYIISAEITPEGKITKFNMKKQTLSE